MHINNLPAELFSEILEYIPLKDASAIMQVNKQWYREYRGTIYRQREAKFEELLYSHWSDWNIPLRLVVYFNWHDFLLDKLSSFCKNFDRHCLERRLQYVKDSLRIDMVDIDKERKVIDNLMIHYLMIHYEASSDFKGPFPDWLLERHRKNIITSGENMRRKNLVYILMKKLREQCLIIIH